MDGPDGFKQESEIYTWTKMAVLWAKNDPGLPEGLYNHQDYECFLVSSAPAGPTKPLSPGPEPGQVSKAAGTAAAGAEADSCTLVILIARDFLQKITCSLYGEKNVFFHNENLPLDRDLQNLICLFIEECQNRWAGYQFILESLATQITINLLRRAKTSLALPVRERSGSEKEKINRAIAFLKERFNEEHSLPEVARLTGFSLYHFIRVFKAHTGKTPHEYLVDLKVEKARELLKFSNFCITEICSRCGFKSPSHFATVFKRKMGKSPSEYRKAIQGTVL